MKGRWKTPVFVSYICGLFLSFRVSCHVAGSPCRFQNASCLRSICVRVCVCASTGKPYDGTSFSLPQQQSKAVKKKGAMCPRIISRCHRCCCCWTKKRHSPRCGDHPSFSFLLPPQPAATMTAMHPQTTRWPGSCSWHWCSLPSS
jgi:hypothetical protein